MRLARGSMGGNRPVGWLLLLSNQSICWRLLCEVGLGRMLLLLICLQQFECVSCVKIALGLFLSRWGADFEGDEPANRSEKSPRVHGPAL